MPTDSRRNQGPDDSENYRLYVSQPETNLLQDLQARKIRTDGRKFNEMRKIYMKTGIAPKAKGSAYVELNRTKVVATVFDPKEIPRLTEFTPNGELDCEVRYLPFSCPERKRHLMSGEDKDMSAEMKRALEPAVCRHEFPNCQVDVRTLILDNDGSCLSACIIAAGLALCDASIPMYDIIASVSLGIQGELSFLDPSYDEEQLCKTQALSCNGLLSVTYMPNLCQITQVSQAGVMEVEGVLKGVDTLVEAAGEVCGLVEECLKAGVALRIAEAT